MLVMLDQRLLSEFDYASRVLLSDASPLLLGPRVAEEAQQMWSANAPI